MGDKSWIDVFKLGPVPYIHGGGRALPSTTATRPQGGSVCGHGRRPSSGLVQAAICDARPQRQGLTKGMKEGREKDRNTQKVASIIGPASLQAFPFSPFFSFLLWDLKSARH